MEGDGMFHKLFKSFKLRGMCKLSLEPENNQYQKY